MCVSVCACTCTHIGGVCVYITHKCVVDISCTLRLFFHEVIVVGILVMVVIVSKVCVSNFGLSIIIPFMDMQCLQYLRFPSTNM